MRPIAEQTSESPIYTKLKQSTALPQQRRPLRPDATFEGPFQKLFCRDHGWSVVQIIQNNIVKDTIFFNKQPSVNRIFRFMSLRTVPPPTTTQLARCLSTLNSNVKPGRGYSWMDDSRT